MIGITFTGINIFLNLLVLESVDGSHFRGGIISWKHVSASNQVQISYRVSFRTTFSSNHNCTDSIIEEGSISNGEGSLSCFSGCSGYIAYPMSYYCTDFSVEEDWSTGERVISHTFNGAIDNVYRFGYTSCCWITIVEGGSISSWSMETMANLTVRQDNGMINTSPLSLMAPIVRLQQYCPYNITIPVADDDGDIIKCRWSNTYTECGQACNKLSGSVLNETACVLSYTPTGRTGWYAVALQVEDFATTTSTAALSSVSLQFLINVYSSNESCESRPVIENTAETEPQEEISTGAAYFQTIIANSGSPLVSITAIYTSSPIGMVKTELHKLTINGTEWYVNVTWTPSENQTGSHIFCYWAQNSQGQQSLTNCQTILVIGNQTTNSLNTTVAESNQTTSTWITTEAESNQTTSPWSTTEAGPNQTTSSWIATEAESNQTTNSWNTTEAESNQTTSSWLTTEADSNQTTSSWTTTEAGNHEGLFPDSTGYTDSGDDFTIVLALICIALFAAVIALAVIFTKRKLQDTSHDSENWDDNDDLIGTDIVPPEPNVAPVHSSIRECRLTNPMYEFPRTPTEIFYTR